MCAKDVKYRGIEEDIIEAIKEGRLRPGARIDSEGTAEELAKRAVETTRETVTQFP